MNITRIWFSCNKAMGSCNLGDVVPSGCTFVSFDGITARENDQVVYEIIEPSEQYPRVGTLVVVDNDYTQAPQGATPVALVRNGKIVVMVEGHHNSAYQITDYLSNYAMFLTV